MYNLIVGFIDGVASPDRLLEYTDDAARQYVAPSGAVDVSRLVNLPTRVMPELQDKQSLQVARVGSVADLALIGRDYRFRFVPDPAVPCDCLRSDRESIAVAGDRRLGVQPSPLGGQERRSLPSAS